MERKGNLSGNNKEREREHEKDLGMYNLQTLKKVYIQVYIPFCNLKKMFLLYKNRIIRVFIFISLKGLKNTTRVTLL
jgi:hypothetical protein